MKVTNKFGREFELVGVEPYQRKDGSMTELNVWMANCSLCDQPFIVKTPVKVNSAEHSTSFFAKHCADHKMSREDAKAHWLKACAEGRARAAEERLKSK